MNRQIACWMTSLLMWLGVVQTGSCFYNPSSGKWLSRDPIAERGCVNLYAFVQNDPIHRCDYTGLSYTISDADPPTGVWSVKVAPNVSVGDDTFMGFHSRYVPANGKNGPPCPCSEKNIILVQAVKDALNHPEHFDTMNPPPAHGPDVPIPPYDRVINPLTIEDAPHFPTSPNWSGNWDFEDCAVCRTQDGQSTTDLVLGCVKFRFHRIDQNHATIDDKPGIVAAAEKPGTLWKTALKNWQTPHP